MGSCDRCWCCAGRFSAYTWSICQFYKAYHQRSVGLDGIFLHDPTALVAVLAPHLFGWNDGAVRVSCDGIARGKTLMDTGVKKCAPSGHMRCIACADTAPFAQLGGRERLERAPEVQRRAFGRRAWRARARDAVTQL
jgi:inosine-uridine nucleoside N-ribohydrolase